MDTINNLIANDFEEYAERILVEIRNWKTSTWSSGFGVSFELDFFHRGENIYQRTYYFTNKLGYVEKETKYILNKFIEMYNKRRIDRGYKNVKNLYNKMKIICIDDEDMIYASIIKYIEDCDEEQVNKYLKSPINKHTTKEIWKAYMSLYIENDVKNKLEKQEFVKNIFQQIHEDKQDAFTMLKCIKSYRIKNLGRSNESIKPPCEWEGDRLESIDT